MSEFEEGEKAMMRRHTLRTGLLVAAALVATASSAHAEVRFGNNVFIGGHNVSNQTFNSQRRGLYVIHEGKPAHEGCVWRSNSDGSRTKVCHLQRKQ